MKGKRSRSSKSKASKKPASLSCDGGGIAGAADSGDIADGSAVAAETDSEAAAAKRALAVRRRRARAARRRRDGDNDDDDDGNNDRCIDTYHCSPNHMLCCVFAVVCGVDFD